MQIYFDGALRITDVTASLDIDVKPNSRHPGMGGFDPWRKRFVVSTSAPPEKGKANKEVLRILTGDLGVKGAVIGSGHTSHQKTVTFEFEPGELDTLLERLDTLKGAPR